MQTQCTTQKLCCKGLGDRRVEAQCTAERITTDTGGLLVREVAEKMNLFEKTADCFTDYRDPDRREREVQELLAQRVMGLVQGYEDLNDHEELREEPTSRRSDVGDAGWKRRPDRGRPNPRGR